MSWLWSLITAILSAFFKSTAETQEATVAAAKGEDAAQAADALKAAQAEAQAAVDAPKTTAGVIDALDSGTF